VSWKQHFHCHCQNHGHRLSKAVKLASYQDTRSSGLDTSG
jgi:hypothetical protein